MQRQYFYTEKGKTKRYHYCIECGTQFKEEQLGIDIKNYGCRNTPIEYCNPCARIKFWSIHKKDKPEPDTHKSKRKYG